MLGSSKKLYRRGAFITTDRKRVYSHAMRLCCCRRRRPNRVEEAEDKRSRNQETLHYTHRDGVVTVTREYSHPSLRGTVTQRTYKSMDDVRLDSRQ